MSYRGLEFSVTGDNTVLTPGVWLGNRVLCCFQGSDYQVWRTPSGTTYSHQGAPFLYAPVELLLLKVERIAKPAYFGQSIVLEVIRRDNPGNRHRSILKEFIEQAKKLDKEVVTSAF